MSDVHSRLTHLGEARDQDTTDVKP